MVFISCPCLKQSFILIKQNMFSEVATSASSLPPASDWMQQIYEQIPTKYEQKAIVTSK